MPSQFLVATGSNLSIPRVREAAEKFKFIVSTPQGCSLAPGMVEKIVCYTNPWCHPSPDRQPWDFYRPPGRELPIVWNPNRPDWVSYGYRFTDGWMKEFVMSVVQWMYDNLPMGILLDDHHPTHSWWAIDEGTWKQIHQGQGDEVSGRMMSMESLMRALLSSRKLGLFVNGQPLAGASRYWENVGQPHRPHALVERYATAGDVLYDNTGDEASWEQTRELASKLDLDYGLGFPDGEPLVDEVGQFRIPIDEV